MSYRSLVSSNIDDTSGL